jgi:hypothetical protein
MLRDACTSGSSGVVRATAKVVPPCHLARNLPRLIDLAMGGHFRQRESFSVSGNFCLDFGMAYIHQRDEILRSQFADAVARDFCLTAAQPSRL